MVRPVDPATLEAEALFHLATGAEWASYQALGRIAPGSLHTEGFVHCSWGRQVAVTVGRHFAGVAGLLALRIDPNALGAARLVEEDTAGSGEAFPHAYGDVPVSAVIDVVALEPVGPTTA